MRPRNEYTTLRNRMLEEQAQSGQRFDWSSLLFFVIVGGVLLFGLAAKGPELLVTYGVVSVERMCEVLVVECDAQDAAPPPPARKVNTIAPSGGAYTTSSGSAPAAPSLPLCSTVQDTTTACEQDQPAEAAQEAPTPVPPDLPTPMPGVVECWEGSFYTCEELAEMGEEKAVEAVQETDAFVDVQTLPTAAPAFVDYATNACAAAAVKSPLCP